MRVNNRLSCVIVLFLLIFSTSYGETLEDKYKKMMDEISVQSQAVPIEKAGKDTKSVKPIIKDSKRVQVFIKDIIESENQPTRGQNKKIQKSNISTSKSEKPIIRDIKDIQSLRKNTFESTSQFTERRNKKVSELNSKVVMSAKKDLSDYSAGTAIMKFYNADNEKITLALLWDKDIVLLWPEITTQKVTSIKIPRNEAKKLFSQKNTHYFYIKISYLGAKLILSDITLLNKYQLYINPAVKKIVQPKKVQSHPKKVQSPPKKEIKAEVDDSWFLWNWSISDGNPESKNPVITKKEIEVDDSWSILDWFASLAWLVIILAFVRIFTEGSDAGQALAFIGILVLFIAKYLIGFNWYIVFILLVLILIAAIVADNNG